MEENETAGLISYEDTGKGGPMVWNMVKSGEKTNNTPLKLGGQCYIRVPPWQAIPEGIKQWCPTQPEQRGHTIHRPFFSPIPLTNEPAEHPVGGRWQPKRKTPECTGKR